MKKLILIIGILFFTQQLIAQDKSKFAEAMENNLQKMSEAEAADDFNAIANTLERIAENETSEWAPRYYATFIKTFQAFEAEDKAAASAVLELATPELTKLFELESVAADSLLQSEIHVLLAMMYNARMMENPMILGAKYMPMNATHLAQAEMYHKENPRLWLLRAQNLYYTPEAFGGDKTKAKMFAQKSITLFEKESDTVTENYMPRWGKEQAENLLKIMK